MNDTLEAIKDLVAGMVRMVKGQQKQSEKVDVLVNETKNVGKIIEKGFEKQAEALKVSANVREPKEIPVNVKTEVEVKEPEWLKKLEPDATIGERILSALDAVRRKIGESGFDAIGSKPQDAIPVILSDGREFYKAHGGGGGSSSAIPYPSINEEAPTTDRKNNPNFTLSYTGDNLTQVDMVIDLVTYRKTLTYTGSQLTAVSKWIEQ
jgi:hypothetical protein